MDVALTCWIVAVYTLMILEVSGYSIFEKIGIRVRCRWIHGEGNKRLYTLFAIQLLGCVVIMLIFFIIH